MQTKDHAVCGISGKTLPRDDLVPVGAIRSNLASLIAKDHPDWAATGFISREALAQYRRAYVESLLSAERGEIGRLEREVVDSFAEDGVVTKNTQEIFEEKITFGQRMADGVARFGGSWGFIGFFAMVMIIWMGINSARLLAAPFDPYPFILLNLMLSCLAAIQAPIIMMSQRRQEQKDRIQSENDYRINLKAELEIRQLHEKIDHQLARQWERLAEIQQIQIEMLEEAASKRQG
jgi:uncharacterized membrane protein